MLEVGLFFLMLVIILGFLALIAWWNGVVERRNMSSDGSLPAPASPRTEPRPPVPQPQYQSAPVQSVNFDAVLAWVIDHNLTEEQGIALIAAAHRAAGDYFLSANKIRDGIGGSRDEVLSQVAALRPRPPAKKIEAHLDRPVKGW